MLSRVRNIPVLAKSRSIAWTEARIVKKSGHSIIIVLQSPDDACGRFGRKREMRTPQGWPTTGGVALSGWDTGTFLRWECLPPELHSMLSGCLFLSFLDRRPCIPMASTQSWWLIELRRLSICHLTLDEEDRKIFCPISGSVNILQILRRIQGLFFVGIQSALGRWSDYWIETWAPCSQKPKEAYFE